MIGSVLTEKGKKQMRTIDADALKEDLTRFYAGEVTARDLIDEQPTIGGWINVKDRLPEAGKHVLATCEVRLFNGGKKYYVCKAYYAPTHTISAGSCPDDYECYEYDEEDDNYYLLEGWYECIHNWDDYSSVVIGDFVTHWMPLPEAPKEDEVD